ncbi:MAG: 50S ribosomal protein L20 [Clostridia bacterium]|nr:50S ribosomal protein L20 [Clostridia bacterium]
MARIKRAVNALKKRRKVFKLAKGYYGAKSKQYRAASQQVMKSMAYAYVGRKLKKREYRKLWIARINAGARLCGTTYSRLINGLKVAGVDINRKVLADLAVNDFAAFSSLVDVAKKTIA